MDAIIGADEAVELVQFAVSLRQVRTGLLYDALLVVFPVQPGGHFRPEHQRQLICLFAPLGHQDDEVLACL